jgi:hypothetical protein
MLSKRFCLESFNGFILNRAYFDAALHAAVADDLSETAKADRIYEAIQRAVDVAASGQLNRIIASETLNPWIKHHQIMVIYNVLDSCRQNRRVRPGNASRMFTF